MKISHLTLLVFLIFASCNEQPIVIPDYVPIITDRVVLIEELTGASCPNCPRGTEKIDSLISRYDDKIVVLAIHGTDNLSAPISGKSKYDFRNEKGEELAEFLRFWYGKPAAAVNRTSYDPTELAVSVPDLWDANVQEELLKEHVMELEVTDITLDTGTRKLEVTLAATALKNLEGDFRISVMVTESHIVDWQKEQFDPPNDFIEDFEFNHMLRLVLSETKGSTLSSGFEQNERLLRSFSADIPTDPDHPELWNTENMELVAFVHRAGVDVNGDQIKEVLQATQVHLPN